MGDIINIDDTGEITRIEQGVSVDLIDEDGVPHPFTLVDIFELDESEYALLSDNEQDPESEFEDIIVMRFEDDRLVSVNDPEEFKRIAAYLQSLDPGIETSLP